MKLGKTFQLLLVDGTFGIVHGSVRGKTATPARRSLSNGMVWCCVILGEDLHMVCELAWPSFTKELAWER